MKKGIVIVVVLVLSFAILSIGNGMLAGNDAVSGKETLTGTAEGFGGEVSVTVVREGGKIVSVEVKGDGETPGIGTNAIDQLPEKIVAANSADVDVVAGATITSEAIIKAVKSALESNGTGGGSTLTGTGEGFGGAVTVTLTMDGDKITDVKIVGDGETAGIGTNAIEQLPEKIIAANSADVDVVAGATVTSNAIIEAVKNALGNNDSKEDGNSEVVDDGSALKGTAKGFGGDVEVGVTMDGDKIANVVIKGDGETPGIGTNAIEQLPAKIVEANSADVDVVAGATITSNAIIEAVKNALGNTDAGSSEVVDDGSALKGTAKGFGGDVTVAVTMDGDKIANVVVKGDGETPGIGTEAIEKLPAKIVEANSADVDIVSGATITSNAIIEAVKSALGNGGAADSGSELKGTAKGFGGDVEVAVTMDGDKIAGVVVKGDGETPGIGTEAIEKLPAKIVEANSADVEVVSGATVTSKAIIEAVKSALAK
ncbi:FMN-binding protein [Sedimentibacter sp.]|uniref:FMN-binding protein n=1 Tax=Sedimentibacter sp. TaxID=1960295 RepID=UPI00289D1DA9|nr:FMN-binding protein [Sedimentibacter sp.]